MIFDLVRSVVTCFCHIIYRKLACHAICYPSTFCLQTHSCEMGILDMIKVDISSYGSRTAVFSPVQADHSHLVSNIQVYVVSSVCSGQGISLKLHPSHFLQFVGCCSQIVLWYANISGLASQLQSMPEV